MTRKKERNYLFNDSRKNTGSASGVNSLSKTNTYFIDSEKEGVC